MCMIVIMYKCTTVIFYTCACVCVHMCVHVCVRVCVCHSLLTSGEEALCCSGASCAAGASGEGRPHLLQSALQPHHMGPR